MFRARLGLTAATLTSSTAPDAAARLLDLVAGEAIDTLDGYAAREVLTHHSSTRLLADQQSDLLTRLVTGSGLGAKTIPQPLLHSLRDSAQVATKALAASLNSPGP